MAFEIVCPERIDLIHRNYRKLCNLLVDVDEWGQVVILSMLTRYARTQFIDPNKTVRTREREGRGYEGKRYKGGMRGRGGVTAEGRGRGGREISLGEGRESVTCALTCWCDDCVVF